MAINVPILSEFNPKGVDEAEKRFEGFGKKAGKAFAIVGAAAAAAAGTLAVGLGKSVKAAAEDQKEQAKLRKTLMNNAGASDSLVASIEDQIGAMSLATGVADSDLRKGLENLVRATGSTELSMETLQTAMDISAATGKDLGTVSLTLGKAYNGQFTALKKLGVPLSENVMETKNFSGAMGELNAAFGGSQAAMAETAEGRFQRLKVAAGEASESIGAALLPAFEKIVGFGTKTLIPAFEKVSKVFNEEGLGGVLKLLGDKLREGIPIALEGLKNLLGDMGNWIINTGLPLLGEKLGQLRDALAAWIKESGPTAMSNLGTFLGDMVEWILTKGVPKLIEATAKLSVALVKWLVDIGPSLLLGLGQFAVTLADGLIDALVAALKGIGRRAAGIGKAFAQGLIDVVNVEVIGRINDLLEFSIAGFTVNPPDIPNIPALANGGIVTGPTLALIGEAGPEAVVPLDRLGGMGGGVTINVHGGDPESVVDALRRYMRMNGSIPIRVGNAY